MKQLSIEEKAKAYDEAVINGSRLWECGEITRENYEYIFPELKESDDERIRKALLESFNYTNPWDFLNNKGIAKGSIVAWLEKQGSNINSIYDKELSELLHKVICRFINDPDIPYSDREKVSMKVLPYVELLEKQGEQKPADKVEPKFHEGDWVVSEFDGKARQISEVCCDKYNNYYVVKGKKYDIEDYDRLHYLWTIQDAKPGDVLVDAFPFIFKEIDSRRRSYAFCGINGYGEFQEKSESESGEWTWSQILKPAAKVERDLLFQKMHEAGYEWDAESLELKTIDKKKPKFKVGDIVKHSLYDGLYYRVTSDIVGDYALECLNGESGDNIAAATEDYLSLWTIQDAKPGDILAYDDNETIAMFWDVYDKESWKDVCMVGSLDKKFNRNLFHDIEGVRPAKKEEHDFLYKKMHEAGYEWYEDGLELKKIEKNTSGWGDKDDVYLEDALNIIETLSPKVHTIMETKKWLKSLKERYIWKPSEEQMEALKEACDEHWEPDGLDPLYTLYQDLKKLREK